jgi:Domain of unknown function (DUF4160)
VPAATPIPDDREGRDHQLVRARVGLTLRERFLCTKWAQIAIQKTRRIFYGITIAMYWNEAAHAQPHFHARYAGRSASVDFNGNVLAGLCLCERSRSSPSGPYCTARNSRRSGSVHEGAKRSNRSRRFPSIPGVGELRDVTGVEVIGARQLRLTVDD